MSYILYLAFAAAFWACLLAAAWLVSIYLFQVYTGKKSRLDRLFGPLESLVYRIAGVDPSRQMGWRDYLYSMAALDLVLILAAFAVLTLQAYLPLNPQHFPGMTPLLAINTAVSIATNTNLQHYAGEVTLSYFSQMAAIQMLQFTSAAMGICAAVAVFRGFSGKYGGLGNFYRDFVMSITRVLLPAAVIAAVVLVALGLPQSLGGYVAASNVGGGAQQLDVGPVASLVAIMQLGTNGGGYFGANSAYPYQNPTPLTNWLEVALMLLFVTSMPLLFGRMAGNMGEGYTLLAAMLVLYGINMGVAFINTPQLATGMEARLGAFSSVFWAVSSTSTMTGSMNASLTAFNPLVILAALMGMFTQASLGGIGIGSVYMLLYMLVAVFVVGLMAGRTPEYLGAKISSAEIRNAAMGFVAHPLLILVPTALAFSIGAAYASGVGSGASGFTQVLYEFTSAAANNGSDFLGAAANTTFFNISTSIVMLLGRFVPITVMLAIAGGLSRRQRTPQQSLRTDTAAFACILVVSILVLVVLTFLPFMVLGPILASLQGLNAI